MQSVFALGIFAVTIFMFLRFLRVFEKLKILKSTHPTMHLIYECYTGKYQNVGKVQDKIYYDLKKLKMDCTKGFGIYYDNPKEVPDTKKCRALAGCILPKRYWKNIEALEKQGFNIVKVKPFKTIQSTWQADRPLSIQVNVLKKIPQFITACKERGEKADVLMEICSGEIGKRGATITHLVNRSPSEVFEVQFFESNKFFSNKKTD
ncbi:hypothetical protein M0813_02348 [Anaeramoeba flamelloides]|uniref:Uncharacterized protein n=1 Tax=Anaeramoeba flamelloides TaxID=1746091 RepID=A0AAV7YGM6_9EUKA|nr:hypothetical protein M0812_25391 [Anaeramoeba flamelloides]KAJ6244383.1 hypothetical protein M0813_02348 [Anaeramoeba flamelloides]|eukprot:Anaeramoba_flamelloidesa597285_116.p1 GENE.a597285_116~~a597285_116.p1  ORF type:complete len:206 (+),score=36.86 a597285_116:36-653(+)